MLDDDRDRDHGQLPPPVLASSTHAGTQRRKKTARIEQGLKVHWARFKKRLGTGSEALTESVVEGGESVEAGACTGSRSRRRETGGRNVMDDDRDADADGTFVRTTDVEDEDDKAVDEVVVDRVWYYSHEHERTSATQSQSEPAVPVGGFGSAGNNINPEKSGGSHQHTNAGTDHDSLSPRAEGLWGLWLPLTILRYRAWPATLDFFSSRFYDEKAEDNYRKEIWFSGKVSVCVNLVVSVLLKDVGFSHLRSGRLCSMSSTGSSAARSCRNRLRSPTIYSISS